MLQLLSQFATDLGNNLYYALTHPYTWGLLTGVMIYGISNGLESMFKKEKNHES